jgi:hypothetical protein
MTEMRAHEMRAALAEDANAPDPTIEKVATPELPKLGGVMFVRTVSAADRDTFGLKELEAMDAYEEMHGPSKYSASYLRDARIVLATACDEHGERLFGWSPEDLALVQTINPLVLGRIAAVGDRLNGLTPGALEKLAGKSTATPAGSDGSSSPDDSEPPAPDTPSEG